MSMNKTQDMNPEKLKIDGSSNYTLRQRRQRERFYKREVLIAIFSICIIVLLLLIPNISVEQKTWILIFFAIPLAFLAMAKYLTDPREQLRQEDLGNIGDVGIGMSDAEKIAFLTQQLESVREKLAAAEDNTVISAEKMRLNELERHFDLIVSRLSNEISALYRRGNLNLMIGIVASATAFVILAVLLLRVNDIATTPESIVPYAARISLTVFAQVFSYFFLHLYRTSQTEIKYFQNELTTLQSRFLALYTALLWDDKESYSSILIETARIERNFILKKDETTPEIEKIRYEKDSTLEMSKALIEAIKMK